MMGIMNLRDVIAGQHTNLNGFQTSQLVASKVVQATYKIKHMLHTKLIESLDLYALENMNNLELRATIESAIQKIVSDEHLQINSADLLRVTAEIQNEIFGLGPLEPLLADPSISDILVNNYATIFVERFGKLEHANCVFDDDNHLLKIIEKIVARVGRRIDESSPMVDARLPDGSRVNAIIPPLSLDGPVLSIRRFSEVPFTMDNLMEFGTLTDKMALILASLVKVKTNILVSGGTGSGKTTLLNIMSGFIPENERIITIEDAAELRLQQPHVVRLETRPPNLEGKGEVTQRALVKNALRMRPDRIVLGEVRGIEVLDMLQAMNTGHEGSLTTVHANSARDSLTRLENMVGLSGITVTQKAMRQQIVSAITVIVHTARLSDGRRKVMSIHEITGMEGDMITMQEVFSYVQTGIASDGSVLGHFSATGVRPRFSERLASRGAALPDSVFELTQA
jgi:pilus assembly protein CpaF